MAANQKQRLENRRRQAQRRQTTWLVIAGVAVVGILGLILAQSGKARQPVNVSGSPQGAVGEMIPVTDSGHVEDGQPVTSPSDPPTSGTHYGVSMPAGFYEPDSPRVLDPTHDGYLIHSLEHGYIIFWYNCDLLDQESCSTLKAEVQSVMDDFGGTKLIAFPRSSLAVPLVMTSWGYLQQFETFDADLAVSFINNNRPLAPEPGGF